MALTTEQYQAVKKVFDDKGIPEYVWFPIMMSESGGNTGSRANTSKEDSRGLFQINVKAHPQWKDVDLYDPVVNAKIAAENFIAPAYAKALMINRNGGGSEEEITAYVWRYGIRPKWTDEKEKSIKQKVKDFLAGGGKGQDSLLDKLNPLPSQSDIKGYIDNLIERFKDFAWILIPLLIGLVILVFTLKSMFLDSSSVVEIVEGATDNE